jgi:hypothetical protein
MSLNNIPDPNQIVAGQSLIIPQGSTPTPDALATATPLPSYGAVRLLQPLDGSRVVGNGMPVLLQWLSSGILRDDETYRVTVDQVGGSIRLPPVYIKATALHVSPDLFPPPGDPNRSLRWTVTIMRQVGVGSDGTPLYQVVSPSASRTFLWLLAPPTPTLTPEPGPNTP